MPPSLCRSVLVPGIKQTGHKYPSPKACPAYLRQLLELLPFYCMDHKCHSSNFNQCKQQVQVQRPGQIVFRNVCDSKLD